MRKLRLDMEALAVESFGTDDGQGARGTVRGNDTVATEWCTGYPECLSRKCPTPADTCYGTCGCTNNCDTVAPYC